MWTLLKFHMFLRDTSDNNISQTHGSNLTRVLHLWFYVDHACFIVRIYHQCFTIFLTPLRVYMFKGIQLIFNNASNLAFPAICCFLYIYTCFFIHCTLPFVFTSYFTSYVDDAYRTLKNCASFRESNKVVNFVIRMFFFPQTVYC